MKKWIWVCALVIGLPGLLLAQQTLAPVGMGDLPATSGTLHSTDQFMVCQSTPCPAGTQLKSATIGQLPAASGGSGVATPQQFGCVGDGTANDTACMQAALNATQGNILNLGPFKYKVGPLTTGTIHLIGPHPGLGIYVRTCDYGLIATNSTETLLTLNSGTNGALIENVCFQMGAAVNGQTAGQAIAIGPGAGNVIRGVQINYPFVGIGITGTAGTQNVHNHIENTVVADPSVGGGVGILIGASSNHQSTVDLNITGTTIDCIDFVGAGPRSGTYGMWFQDSGGAFITNNDIYGCGIGTALWPQTANQYVGNNFFSNSVLGDTSATNDLLIDTAASTNGVGLGNVFQGTWTASAAGTSVLIKNTGGGSIWGNHFIGHRFFPLANQTALDVEASNNLTVASSFICPQGNVPGSLIVLNGQLWSFSGNLIGQCEGFPATTFGNGFNINATAGAGRLRDNTFFGTFTNPINWPTSGATTASIGDNMGIDNLDQTVASASAITLPFGRVTLISGTATITTINTMWSSREINLIALGNITFSTGGNICDTITVPAGQQVFGVWLSVNSCWRLDHGSPS